MHRARERLLRLARAGGIKLRQSYVRVDKFALIKHQRYAHPKQFKRANKALRRIRTLLGRVIRDVRRKIADTRLSVTPSPCRCRWPIRFATSVNGSAARRSTRCTRQRSNASVFLEGFNSPILERGLPRACSAQGNQEAAG